MSYADIAKAEIKKQEKTMKAFIKSEREEERWMNTTKCNLMLHNLGENKNEETKEEQRRGDIDYVEEVIRNQMGLKVKIITAERIGVRNNETMFKTKKWRPCKVTLANEEQKNQIMASVNLENWISELQTIFQKRSVKLSKNGIERQGKRP